MIIKNKNIIGKICMAFLVGLALAPTFSISLVSADQNKNLFTNTFNQKKGKLIINGKEVLVGLPRDIDLGQNGSYVYFTMEREEYLQGHKKEKEGNREVWQDREKTKYYFLAVSASPLYVRTQSSENRWYDKFIYTDKERRYVTISDKIAMNGTDDLWTKENVNRKIIFLGTDKGESVLGSKSGFVDLPSEYNDKVIANVYKGDYYYYNENTGKNYFTYTGRYNYVNNGAVSGYDMPFLFTSDMTVKPKILHAGGSVKYTDGQLREIEGADKVLASTEVIKNQTIVTPEVEKILEKQAELKDKDDHYLANYEKEKKVEFKKNDDGSYKKDKEGLPELVEKTTDNKTGKEYKGLFEFLIFDAEVANRQTARMFQMFGLNVPTPQVIGDGASQLGFNPIIDSAFTAGGGEIVGGTNYLTSGNGSNMGWLEASRGYISALLRPVYYCIFLVYCWRRSRTMFD